MTWTLLGLAIFAAAEVRRTLSATRRAPSDRMTVVAQVANGYRSVGAWSLVSTAWLWFVVSQTEPSVIWRFALVAVIATTSAFLWRRLRTTPR